MTLWHYTCRHGLAGIEKTGTVLSLAGMSMRSISAFDQVAWFTDLDYPDRDALGLSMRDLNCDRARHRFRVLDDSLVTPWIHAPLRRHPSRFGYLLETSPGALPRHWFIATEPVPVTRDERPTLERTPTP